MIARYDPADSFWMSECSDGDYVLYADHIAALEAAEAKAARLEAERDEARPELAIANRGGLDLLYAIRKAIGWTDKHGLSLLPDECARIARIASRKGTSIMPAYPPGYPGGGDI